MTVFDDALLLQLDWSYFDDEDTDIAVISSQDD